MVSIRGRGSAKINGLILLFLTLIFLLFSAHFVEGGVYKVGDNGGWTFNSVGWANGKTFKAGDQLVFEYSPMVHNVVSVSSSGYKNCKAPKGSSKAYKSGNDSIQLPEASITLSVVSRVIARPA